MGARPPRPPSAAAVPPGDAPVPPELEALAAPHVQSFDYFLEHGLNAVVEGLDAVEVDLPGQPGIAMRYWLSAPFLGTPTRDGVPAGADARLFPRDCREAGSTYRAPLSATLSWAPAALPDAATGAAGVLLGPSSSTPVKLGALPIMIKSRACRLRGLTAAQLVAAREERVEFGGQFVANGIDRVLRAVIIPRRHTVMALRRGAYAKRGPRFTDLAAVVRCVRPDESAATVRLHYLSGGGAAFAVTVGRAEFFVPAGLVLRALGDATDRELYEAIVGPTPRGEAEGAAAGRAAGGGRAAAPTTPAPPSPAIADAAEAIIRQAAARGLRTRAACLAHLGSHFRAALADAAGGDPGWSPLARLSDAAVGARLVRDHLFVHLDGHGDGGGDAKLAYGLALVRRLLAVATGGAGEDDADAATAHEVLLPGALLASLARDRLREGLSSLASTVARDLAKASTGAADAVDPGDAAYVSRTAAARLPDLGGRVEYLLNTGNLIPAGRGGAGGTGDLPQTSGFSIVAERLNWSRYLSHFRSVHRGAYFAQLRTTAVRKLRPEAWGFLCPVHTPDGAPCGLLNHLAAGCRVVAGRGGGGDGGAGASAAAEALLLAAGVLPLAGGAGAGACPPAPGYLEVVVDGRFVGCIPAARAPAAVASLRAAKSAALAEEAERGQTSTSSSALPAHAEVALIPPERGGPYPGLYVFTGPGRMVRPVARLQGGGSGEEELELIGPLEQAFLAVRCPDGGAGGSAGLAFTHAELAPTAPLSVVASLTPFSNYNQSPRNMYQCQMAKQTMGTPALALPHRPDGKLYRLHTPQTPLARCEAAHAAYAVDDYPSGTNAIVAVLAATGYDMEDAMILNAASVQRGFGDGSVIKVEALDLAKKGAPGAAFGPDLAPERPHAARGGGGGGGGGAAPGRPTTAFGQDLPAPAPAPPGTPARPDLHPLAPHRDADRVDADGLPHVGAVVYPGQAYACVVDGCTGRASASKLKGEEVGVVDRVTVVGGTAGGASSASARPAPGIARANVVMRLHRPPVVGDKFSSRHGQKGVLSRLWPDADMPWAEANGMRPDLLINPHAFPSRMTIGMLVESLASKAGALGGHFVDATPFAGMGGGLGGEAAAHPATTFGDALERAGFSSTGAETLVCGSTGLRFAADIFVGPVYYQRLRHMVADKFQVRSTGPVNALTRQPIKGRKFGGGIRFGEMERDALLSHGASALLFDRLHASSDYSVADVCSGCGSLLAPAVLKRAAGSVAAHLAEAGGRGAGAPRVVCRACGSSAAVRRVAVPYVFRFLATELAAMNIKTTLAVS